VPGGETPKNQERYERKDPPASRRLLESCVVTATCVTLSLGVMRDCADR